MICGHSSDEPLYSNVPLSCVPPMRLFCGCLGSNEKLWNCSVTRPLFRTVVWSGPRHRSDWQYATFAGTVLRLAHSSEASANLPFVRSGVWVGLFMNERYVR